MIPLDPNSTLAASRSSFAPASKIPPAPIQVGAWPTEKPLFILVLLVSLGLWALLAISIIGLAYVALIGLFLFFVPDGETATGDDLDYELDLGAEVES